MHMPVLRFCYGLPANLLVLYDAVFMGLWEEESWESHFDNRPPFKTYRTKDKKRLASTLAGLGFQLLVETGLAATMQNFLVDHPSGKIWQHNDLGEDLTAWLKECISRVEKCILQLKEECLSCEG